MISRLTYAAVGPHIADHLTGRRDGDPCHEKVSKSGQQELAMECFAENVSELLSRVGLGKHPDLSDGLARCERYVAVP